MINIDDFVKRLEKILEYYGLSASAFADTVGIQRSGVSHLMSGRNKPSLDLVMKISDSFPEVDLYWLLNGNGTFPKSDAKISGPPPASTLLKAPPPESPKQDSGLAPDLFSNQHANDQLENLERNFNRPENMLKGDIERIVVFYKGGTFKSYIPEN
ncbi:helix-turn-helix domain-containing protein [Flavobacterium sp. RHBU_24]|uniref:helix-turn-helix domain-containing protein n=1 Tax=Flavobacterium sp. RHBU_24 TaxID=3391185 RepID=UPI003984FA14